jgi:His-Xaa-Ser repeat protein HxsA
MTRRFMIGGLLAAGFGHHEPLQATLTRATSTDQPDQGKLFQIFRQDHLFTLAGHASHSSHSSHSSHASHASGSGGGHSSHFSHTSHYSSTGGYTSPSYSPSPVYTPPSPSTPSYSPRSNPSPPSSDTPSQLGPSSAAGLKPLPGHSALFKQVVMRLQVALMGRGLFEGPINGAVGPKTRTALRAFQQMQGLTITGTITPETLDALHVPSQ